MDRILGANYTIIAGQRRWVNKNLGAGIPGTTFDKQWFDGVQEALVRPIEMVGLTPDASNLDQNTVAALIMARANVTTVTGTTALTTAQAGVIVVNAAANMTLTLPLANSGAAFGLSYEFIRLDTTGNTVTITLTSPGSPDTWASGGSASVTLVANGPQKIVAMAGNKWLEALPPGRGLAILTNGVPWVCPPNVFQVEVDGTAGGGSGGGGLSDGFYWSAGGAGCTGQNVMSRLLSVVPGTSYPVAIGAGGLAVTIDTDGNAGGVTSLGSLLTLIGGDYGRAGTGTGSGSPGPGAGGTPIDASQVAGQPGSGFGDGTAGITQRTTLLGGRGGQTPFGAFGAGGDGGRTFGPTGKTGGLAGGAGYLRLRW